MPVKTHSADTIYMGRVITLTRESVTLENGVETKLDIVRHPGATAIIPFISRGSILMLRQYRHALADHIWEIPAGTLNAGESPDLCAKRELEEETGYVAEKIVRLGEIIPVPGYSDELIHLYMATDLRVSGQNLDRDEVIEVREVGFYESFEMIRKGEIRDSKTISGLFMTRDYLERRRDG